MTPHVQHNLPAEPNRFVGRDRDVAELTALVHDERVVTLCGVGGIGKTRLSLRVAATALPGFADGVWLVQLARLDDPGLVLREMTGVLGVREEGPGRLLDGLRARLSGARTLILLDNCEHLVESCAELVAGLIADCPQLRFLLTSREPLRIPGELVWRVPPLDLPDERHPDAESVLLFVERAAAAGARAVTGGTAGVTRLCRALDGLPLALELAAARTSVLDPGRIADRIDDRLGDRFRLLTTGDRTAHARQRTLLATVEWSHDLLQEGERVLLRRLSVFAGRFDLDLAEQVCAGPGLRQGDVLDLLSGLVDKSLVLHHGGGGRYHLLETIRHYAAGRLRESGEEPMLRRRHLRVVCAEMERCYEGGSLERRLPWPERAVHFARGRALLGDCQSAVDWAVESGAAELGLRLARAALAILAVRGDLRESVGWHERLLRLDLSDVPADVVAVAKGALAYALETRDELARAAELIEESIEEQRRHPYTHWLGVTYSVALTVFFRLGRGDTALRHLRELEEATAEHDDLFNMATARIARLNLALFQGQPRQARRIGEEALALARESGHHWTLARVLTHLGTVAEASGDLEAAMRHHTAALPLLEELDNLVELARCRALAARVAALRHDFPAARSNVAAGLALSRKAGSRGGVVRALVTLSVLAQAEGDLDGAVLAAAAAGALRESIGQHDVPARTQELLSSARDKLGEGRVALLWATGAQQDPAAVAGRILDQATLPPAAAAGAAVRELRHVTLTPREREIAVLLTRGLSNRACAAELVISPATVARHVANIMEKLGLTSRAQIAVWAAEHERENPSS
ncbi:ATP-binding protein [Nonomuraea rhizosphaerae]|uniref:ATP-binding protein n=1 Tax=Nonomuraea rhizosphaerae TaxID=2665663 RepID=UPI001C5D9119|nr:LuxR C-terminal-related transcriptional regulator [Nonomuraea rhizosphaerae]